jgi:hypothetical protein
VGKGLRRGSAAVRHGLMVSGEEARLGRRGRTGLAGNAGSAGWL